MSIVTERVPVGLPESLDPPEPDDLGLCCNDEEAGGESDVEVLFFGVGAKERLKTQIPSYVAANTVSLGKLDD